MDDSPDGSLVKSCRDGDRQAFATLVRRHTRHVFAVCYGILGNVEDAEDAAQDVFFRAMTRIGSLNDGSRFAAWIGRIAANHSRDLIRSRKRRERLARAEDAKPLNCKDFSGLHEALRSLPEDDRVPLMLFYFDGRSAKSVARALNLSHAGACTRLSRARRKLRVLMQQEGIVT